MALRNFVGASNGTFNTLVAGSVVPGLSVFLGRSTKKAVTVSARVQLTAATATLTLATKWQVSIDNVNWIDVVNGPQNAASVVVTTGTSAIVTKIIPIIEAAYAFAWARLAVVTGVVTGGASDLWVIDYSYRQLTASDNAA